MDYFKNARWFGIKSSNKIYHINMTVKKSYVHLDKFPEETE